MNEGFYFQISIPTWRNPSELLPVAAYETFFGNVI